MRYFGNFAVSEVTGYLLTLLIVSVAVSTLIFWGSIHLSEQKAIISQDAARIQLDAVQDMIYKITNEGVGSSKSTNLKLKDINTYFTENSARFVVYYSTYNYNSLAGEIPFKFDIYDIEDNNEEFSIQIISLENNINLEFIFKKHTSPIIESRFSDNFPSVHPPELPYKRPISFVGESIEGLVEILIQEEITGKSYGHIWIFDLNSLNFESTASSEPRSIILENGGFLTVSNGAYLYYEPKNWSNSLLNGTKLCALGFYNFKLDTNSEMSGGNVPELKLDINFTKSKYLIKDSVKDEIKVMIYCENTLEKAWYNYYKNKLGFVDYTNSDNQKLIKLQTNQFAVNYFEYLFSYEVIL